MIPKWEQNRPICLAVGRGGWARASSPELTKSCTDGHWVAVPLGQCKKGEFIRSGDAVDVTLKGASDPQLLCAQVGELIRHRDDLGFVIKRINGKPMLLALLPTKDEAEEVGEQMAAFAQDFDPSESDVPPAEEVQVYIVRINGDGGEEVVFHDPPGGVHRADDWSNEYEDVTPDDGLRFRNLSKGIWQSGGNMTVDPDASLLRMMNGRAGAITVPNAGRVMIWPDGYQAYEEGTFDGFTCWRWCVENCAENWWWWSDGGDTAKVSFVSLRDQAAFNAALGHLAQ